MAEWLTKSEAEGLLRCSDSTIERRLSSGDIIARESGQSAPNGRPAPEYSADSVAALLDSEGLRRLRDLLLTRATAPLASESSQDLVKAPIEGQYLPAQESLFKPDTPAEKKRLAVPPEKQAEVDRRHRAIAPLLAWERGERPVFHDETGAPIRTKDQLAAWLAAQHNVGRATLWNWLRRWKEQGDAGLLPEVRNDKGVSRFFSKHGAAAKFVLAKFAEGQGHYSDALIADALEREWSKLYGGVSHAPSVATVREFLRGVPRSIRDTVALPRQQYDAKHAPYLITNIAAVKVNGIWICDHRIYDVIVYNDCFPGAPRFADLRLWETCIEDMRSRVIVGSVWNTTPSSRTIASALRQAIQTYGLPDLFYCDNGKDFRSIGGGWHNDQAAQDLDEEGRIRMAPAADALLARLGIPVKFCVPRHPQSKSVESYFATVSKRFDVMFLRSYAGNKPSQRPDVCREAEKQHKLFEKGDRQSSPFIPASAFVALHRQWTYEFNSTHAHGGRGMEKRAPLDVMNELLPAGQRRIPDMAQLEPLFWDRVERKVSNCKIDDRGYSYEGIDAAAAAAMYLANDSRIMVARDPHDRAYALALDGDGRLIARLHCQELVARGPQSEDAVKAVSRFRHRVFRAGKQYWNLVQQGVPTEIELLAERARLNQASQGLPLLPTTDNPTGTSLRLPIAAAAGAPPQFAEDFAARWGKED